MRILFRKNLPDGRNVVVYDDKTEQNNIITVIKMGGIIPNKIIKLSDEEEEWRDELPKILGISKEELGLD